MFIRIGGVPGVGKTTVIDALFEASKSHGLPIARVKGGDYLLKLAGVKTYDELRKMPEEYRASLRPEMYRLMYEEDRKSPEIFRLRDAHFTLLDQESGKTVTFPVFPEDKDQMFSMIVLTADPKVIISRRSLDHDRPDRYLDPKTIEQELEIEIDAAMAQAKEIDIPLSVIDNSEEGVAAYKKVIESAFPEGQMRDSLVEAVFGRKHDAKKS